MKRIVLISAILLAVMASCSSPKSKGEQIAKEECQVMDSYVQNTVAAYTTYIKGFGNKGYKTRIEAREDLNRSLAEADSLLSAELSEVEEKFAELCEKYKNDTKKYAALCDEYDKQISAYAIDTTRFAELRKQADNKIMTIIPPSHDKEKVKEDLIGRVIHELPGGYLGDNWTWKIAKGEIKDLRIRAIDKIDRDHKEYTIEMRLQKDKGAVYKVNGKIYYVLEDRDDWEIDMFEPSEIEIVKTGRYKNSIIVTATPYWGGIRLSFQNISDAALLVGFTRIDDDGMRTKHSALVAGGQSYSYPYSVKDYSIDFVERP